jgi:hypothetical protein
MCRKDKPKATCEVEEERSTMKKSRLSRQIGSLKERCRGWGGMMLMRLS